MYLEALVESETGHVNGAAFDESIAVAAGTRPSLHLYLHQHLFLPPHKSTGACGPIAILHSFCARHDIGLPWQRCVSIS